MPADVKTRFYTTEKLGPKQSATPEGFLLCEDVPIARTGTQIYGEGETPIPARDGRVTIHREPEEVFRPETIASFNGKPVVNEHPDSDVTPRNWNDLAVGVVMNTRRAGDLLVADLLLTNADAIKDVQAGKRQVSCGYDADYVAEDGVEGVGYQKNIVGNHVALVDEARCGSRCSIGDKKQTHDACSCKGEMMTTRERIMKSVRDALPGIFKPEHEPKLEEALKGILTKDDGEMSPTTHIHMSGDRSKYNDSKLDEIFAAHDAKFKAHDDAIAAHESKLTAHDAAMSEEEKEKKASDEETRKIEGDLEEEAPQGTGDRARKAKDSIYMEDAFAAAAVNAEIIVPGISLPVYDRAAAPAVSYKALCGLRKKALQFAATDVSGGRAQLLDGLTGGRTLDAAAIDAMPCGKARDMFNALAVLVKNKNNDSNRSSDFMPGNREHSTAEHRGMPLTLAELNRRHKDKFKTAQ